MRKTNFIAVLPFIFLIGCSYATTIKIDDIESYEKVADDCQYLSGEWDSTLPEERKLEIEKEVNVTCSKAKKLQKQLREKYKGKNDILNEINKYDF
ncbi:hypothetical protein OK023_03500 [Serratia sp. UGAL515B_01]|nr:hypothetical protein OK023_03500 [Serratia sp. UGAL515B_01]